VTVWQENHLVQVNLASNLAGSGAGRRESPGFSNESGVCVLPMVSTQAVVVAPQFLFVVSAQRRRLALMPINATTFVIKRPNIWIGGKNCCNLRAPAGARPSLAAENSG